MRILISNKFYYPKGGDSIHAFGLENLLKSKGHQVAFFAMQHPLNKPSEYSSYFPSEIDYTAKNLRNIKEQILRPIFSSEVKNKFLTLLNDFKPDVLHVHNIHSQISPLVVELAYKKDIPVVWTLHDYKLLCPRYNCLRDNRPCELCFTDKKNVIRYRCMRNSFSGSILAYSEALKWNLDKITKLTSHFICPSEFIKQKMISGGFDKTMFTVLPNFILADKLAQNPQVKESYYCYVGRLSKEKGVETLLKTAKELSQYPLKMIGTGPLFDYLLKQYNYDHIEFCGHKTESEVQNLLSKALFSVIPSEWYENNPLAVIESLCLGTPVLGADIGGIPELITENTNGFLFKSADSLDLRKKIDFLWQKGIHEIDVNIISHVAREKFSSELYYDKLLKIYQRVIRSSFDMTQSRFN